MGQVVEFEGVRPVSREDIAKAIRKKGADREPELSAVEGIERAINTSHMATFPDVMERELVGELRGLLKSCGVPEWMVNSYIAGALGYRSKGEIK